jgi:hypothetical protein
LAIRATPVKMKRINTSGGLIKPKVRKEGWVWIVKMKAIDKQNIKHHVPKLPMTALGG